MLITSKKVGVGYAAHKGRGVYARKDIQRGETIEVCPLIPFGSEESHLFTRTFLGDFVYEISEDCVALALGYGSLYNHATRPNPDFDVNVGAMVLVIKAKKDICEGEEITLMYNDSYNDDMSVKKDKRKRK